jgi:hypothetical protein
MKRIKGGKVQMITACGVFVHGSFGMGEKGGRRR